jgi:hypothetical protein
MDRRLSVASSKALELLLTYDQRLKSYEKFAEDALQAIPSSPLLQLQQLKGQVAQNCGLLEVRGAVQALELGSLCEAAPPFSDLTWLTPTRCCKRAILMAS